MFITYAKIIILVLMLVVGFSYFDIENFTPLFIEEKGVLGTFEAAALLYYAFAGFDVVTTLNEEVINPIKDIPKSI